MNGKLNVLIRYENKETLINLKWLVKFVDVLKHYN